MADDKPKITRRRVLGSMATVGAAGAMGAGSWAYFNDEESITDNLLKAGALDLKLSWTESYHGSRQDSYYGKSGSGDGPIFNLTDVKPGDWGEATIEMDVIGNAARVILNGDITGKAENGRNEPERKVDGDSGGELDNKIMAQMWYDSDCDNNLDSGSGDPQNVPLEVALVSDTSGSMSGNKIATLRTAAKDFVDLLSSPDEGAAISFSSGASVDQGLTKNYQAVKNAISNYTAGGSTNMGAGIDAGANTLLNGANASSNADKVMVLLSDGAPNSRSDAKQAAQAAKGAGIRLITIAFGSGANTTLMETLATSSSDAYVASTTNLDDVYDTIARTIGTGGGGEQVFASGTLNEVMAKLNDFSLSPDKDGCYSPGVNCIGFEWWLPEGVGNVVQTDSVEFDFMFRAEQCRHNPAQRPKHGDVPSGGGSSGTTTTTTP